MKLEIPTPLGAQLDGLLPPFETWRRRRLKDEAANLPVPSLEEAVVAASPYFEVERGVHYAFEVMFTLSGPGGATIGFRDRWNRWCHLFENPKAVVGEGPFRIIVPLRMEHRAKVNLCLVSHAPLRDVKIVAYDRRPRSATVSEADTYLPHWNWRQRMVHRLCKKSRLLNTMVASYEMRRGREEVLSVPQYMSLCPTGQCNALCAFCSVTINRTGIIKRQLPFKQVQDFLAPMINVVRMFGLEGNGEPTLFNEFGPLLSTLTEHGASSYLITNGTRLTQDHVDLLVASPVPSVNVSLNAATAETHERVMKLKEFHDVSAGIRRLLRTRGLNGWPAVSTSFVVDADNVHEVQDFLRFAEYDLQVDFIVVRPLSELGGDLGTVEDFREIVPYESDIKDMIDSVREYLADVPRRQLPGDSRIRSWVTFDPQSFHSVRPDPPGRIVMPRGYEGRVLAPRRNSWEKLQESLDVKWHLNTVTLTRSSSSQPGDVWKSSPIPVEPDRRLLFRAHVELRGAPVTFTVRTIDGAEMAANTLQPSDASQTVEMNIDTGTSTRAVYLVVSAPAGPFTAAIDFERVRTPPEIPDQTFMLPHRQRWTIDTPGTVVKWKGSRQSVSYEGKPGPYLVKTYSVGCPPNHVIELPISAEVTSGALLIGVLNQDFSTFITHLVVEEGRHATVLRFSTGDNRRVQIVLCAKRSPLAATIDWGDQVSAAHEWEADEPTSDEAEYEPPSAAPQTVVAERAADEPKPAIRFYCQKPWTDLNSFSVDGRMDVCCIATGPSQERFALGNMFEHSFQEIWNGARAREFRRTVNDPNPDVPLPPCQRCPLAYKYQGPFFDPKLTPALASKEIMELIPPALTWRLDRVMGKCLLWGLEVLNDQALSKGFKK